MADAAALELPTFEPTDVSMHAESFHETLAELAASSWVARMPLGYLVLERDAGEFFLRSRQAVFPGQLIAEVAGVTDGPLREEIDHNILHTDGDLHRRLRGVLNPFFTPRASDRWREAMRAVIADITSGLLPVGRCEFVSAVAQRYPAEVIATVMGAPRADGPRLHEWSHWMQSQFDSMTLLAERDRIEAAVRDFMAWCDELIERRRDEPGDDLISLLIAAEESGRIDRVELRHLVLDVLAGGVDTTHAQLAHALRLFALAPDQWRLLAEQPELAASAVEEVLRHEPVTPFTARVLTSPVTYRDIDFPAGSVMLVASAAGNRQQIDPPEFDITASRHDARLMTFGAGIHFCVGANLARAELEEALTFLAPRMPNLRLDGDAEHGTVQGIYELRSLPLAWDA
jgi:cytochrome P450